MVRHLFEFCYDASHAISFAQGCARHHHEAIHTLRATIIYPFEHVLTALTRRTLTTSSLLPATVTKHHPRGKAVHRISPRTLGIQQPC